MASADIKYEKPKARLPKYDENPYQVLDPTQASANFFDTVEPSVSYAEARQRGKRLVKTASVIAALGLGTGGTVWFTENVLHNKEHVPRPVPTQTETNR